MFARRASLSADTIEKIVFILSPFLLLVQNTMHCFLFSKRASAQKYARPRWLFYKFVFHHLFPSPFIHYYFFGWAKAGTWARRKPRQPL